MNEWIEAWRALDGTARSAIMATVLGLGLLLLVGSAERLHRLPMSAYRTRGFRNDLLYWFYYRLGLHQWLFLGAAYALLATLLPTPGPRPLEGLPFALQALIYFAVVDFCVYWLHRAQHAVPWLWAFHSVHHSQTELTFATSQRVHPLDHLLLDIAMFLPLSLLGFHEAAWIPLYLAGELTLALQHSRLPWTYGPLYRVLVSPVFHQCHHARDPRFHDRNFAGIFSFWDHLFGTAAKPLAEAPRDFGLDGVHHAGFVDTLVEPFRRLFRRAPRTLSDATHVRD